MATLSHSLEYALALTARKVAGARSPEGADAFAARLGTLVHAVYGRRRRVATDNLRRALGDSLSDVEQAAVVRRVFQNMARSIIEMSRFEQLGPEGARRIIVGEGIEHVEEARRRGTGALICTAHFGNWELLGAWFAAMGHPMHLLVGIQHNPYIDRMLSRFRQAMGVKLIPATVGARGILRALKANHVVGVAADQHAGAGLPIEFFGRRAYAARGPATFTAKVGAPLIPYLMRRERFDRHVVMAGKPLTPAGSGDPQRDIDDMTIALNRFYEDTIRRYPDQWMWTHRRWKSVEKESNL